MTQKINWTNVGKGVAYFVMGVGSVCGIDGHYQKDRFGSNSANSK